MRTCAPEELPAPDDVRAAVREFLDRLNAATDHAGQIIVFGSAARGEYGPDSDVDLWVDWDGDEHDASGLLAEISVDVLAHHGVLITAMAFDGPHRQRMAELDTLFFRAVHGEGMVVARA